VLLRLGTLPITRAYLLRLPRIAAKFAANSGSATAKSILAKARQACMVVIPGRLDAYFQVEKESRGFHTDIS